MIDVDLSSIASRLARDDYGRHKMLTRGDWCPDVGAPIATGPNHS